MVKWIFGGGGVYRAKLSLYSGGTRLSINLAPHGVVAVLQPRVPVECVY
jgi:hypothetical protein